MYSEVSIINSCHYQLIWHLAKIKKMILSIFANSKTQFMNLRNIVDVKERYIALIIALIECLCSCFRPTYFILDLTPVIQFAVLLNCVKSATNCITSLVFIAITLYNV
jgi:hypothetical protein